MTFRFFFFFFYLDFTSLTLTLIPHMNELRLAFLSSTLYSFDLLKKTKTIFLKFTSDIKKRFENYILGTWPHFFPRETKFLKKWNLVAETRRKDFTTKYTIRIFNETTRHRNWYRCISPTFSLLENWYFSRVFPQWFPKFAQLMIKNKIIKKKNKSAILIFLSRSRTVFLVYFTYLSRNE